MTVRIVYLDAAEVCRNHLLVIQQTGESAVLLQPNLLDKAVAQPGMSFGGQEAHPDVPAKAAAELFHLCKNHHL